MTLVACQNSSGSRTDGIIELPPPTLSNIQQQTETEITVNGAETISPSRTLHVPESADLFFEVPNVSSQYIADIRWSIEDEQVLIFAQSDTSGNLQWWAYDLLAKTLQPIEQAVAIIKTSSDLNPLPAVLDMSGFALYDVVNVSPSGKRVLLFEGTGAPTATPVPNPDGETSNEAYIANVWLWDTDGMHEVGQIEVCGRNKYLWTTQENMVAIQAPSSTAAECRIASAWLVDTVNKVIKPLLPYEVYHNEAKVVSFSPDENKLLIHHYGPVDEYGNYVSVEVADIQTGGVFKADIQATPLDWLSNDQILIQFRNTPEELFRPGVLQLPGNEVKELFTQDEISSFAGQTVGWIALSPDKHWLAFTVDLEPYGSSSLWIKELE
ncbi:MAG: hypothetical protein KJ069_11380 [Anaerolineae bacterium]|nr:hypothetical protein [Anaerolineae bacterium]